MYYGIWSALLLWTFIHDHKMIRSAVIKQLQLLSSRTASSSGSQTRLGACLEGNVPRIDLILLFLPDLPSAV